MDSNHIVIFFKLVENSWEFFFSLFFFLGSIINRVLLKLWKEKGGELGGVRDDSPEWSDPCYNRRRQKKYKRSTWDIFLKLFITENFLRIVFTSSISTVSVPIYPSSYLCCSECLTYCCLWYSCHLFKKDTMYCLVIWMDNINIKEISWKFRSMSMWFQSPLMLLCKLPLASVNYICW